MRLDSTYRLQFRNGMTFDDAAAVVPYLRRLGVSHLYASPIFAAAGGSTHGYDVIDHNRFDPTLGGRDGFLRLSDTLRDNGIGLLLDIVPNHMAATSANPWWASLLEWGRQSPYAHHFDIDWSDGYITLPFLGASFDECLARGELSVTVHSDGRLVLAYYDNWWPLTPSSYGLLLAGLAEGWASEIADRADHATSHDIARLREVIRGTAVTRPLDQALDRLSQDTELMQSLHRAQPWRLFEWREGRRHLTYRRFFEITGLVGVRIEDEAVFRDVHRTILELVAEGRVDGLRIDHVDGLVDPTGYLKRLREAVGPDVPIVVEKILEGKETLPPEWPVEGTTGYEFIAALAAASTDGGKSETLSRCYGTVRGDEPDYQEELRLAKQEIITHNLEGELSLLSRNASRLAAALAPHLAGEKALREIIATIIMAFPIYRTYVNASGPRHDDLERLSDIKAGVDASASGPDEAGRTDFIFRLLRLDVPEEHRNDALAFVTRFQQTTGPVMAKAVEDTLFYRFNRLIALNEVGGDPMRRDTGCAAFHAAMEDREKVEPRGLSASATHDTKRGEDARARLYTISEAPERWANAVERWRSMHAGFVTIDTSGLVPDGETEWMLYQALLGAWPVMPESNGWLQALGTRFLVFVEKAMREDKRHTRWTEVDETYEAAIRSYAERLVDPENVAFIEDFSATVRPFVASGILNSLSQTLVKLTAPGVPDIYNGTEAWDMSFVDPDNRRPVDFRSLALSLERTVPWPNRREDIFDGSAKQHLIAAGLKARSESADLFAEGRYVPIGVSGDQAGHVIAFARRDRSRCALVVVPYLVFGLIEGGAGIPPERWRNTFLELDEDMRALQFRNMLTNEVRQGSDLAGVATALGAAPVGLFLSQ